MANAKIVVRSKNNFGAMATSGTDAEGRTEGSCFCIPDSELLAESATAGDAAGSCESLCAKEEGEDAVAAAGRAGLSAVSGDGTGF